MKNLKVYMETEDLIIRDSNWEDIDKFYEWELIPDVTEFFSIRDGQSYDEVLKKYVEDYENYAQKQLTICLKSTGERIGRIVLTDIKEGWKVELWRIYIGELSMRGKGYGKQATKAVMKLAFDEWNMERLYLDHYSGNPAAKLYADLGFKDEGILRMNCMKNGKMFDVHQMSMLKEEYDALKS